MIGSSAKVQNAYIDKGTIIDGTVEHSVVSTDAQIGSGALVKNSVILRGASVGENASLEYVIVAENIKIGEGVSLSGTADNILLIDKNTTK